MQKDVCGIKSLKTENHIKEMIDTKFRIAMTHREDEKGM